MGRAACIARMLSRLAASLCATRTQCNLFPGMITVHQQKATGANRHCRVGDSASRSCGRRLQQSHHCSATPAPCLSTRSQPSSSTIECSKYALTIDLVLDEGAAPEESDPPVVATALLVLAEYPGLSALAVLDEAMHRHSGEDLDFQFDPDIELAPPHPFAELIRRAFAPQLDPTEISLSLAGVQFEDAELRSRTIRTRRSWEHAVRRFANRYGIWDSET